MRNLIKKIEDFVFPPFDVEAHRINMPKAKTPGALTPTKKTSGLIVRQYKVQEADGIKKVIKYYREGNDTDNYEWTVADNTDKLKSPTKRIPTITEFDRQALKEKADKYPDIKLTEEKAVLAKEYWMQGIPRNIAGEAIMAKSGQKGFSERIIKELYSVFNLAFERQQSITTH